MGIDEKVLLGTAKLIVSGKTEKEDIRTLGMFLFEALLFELATNFVIYDFIWILLIWTIICDALAWAVLLTMSELDCITLVKMCLTTTTLQVLIGSITIWFLWKVLCMCGEYAKTDLSGLLEKHNILKA